MPFYDSFLERGRSVSPTGRKIIHAEILNRVRFIQKYSLSSEPKILELGPGKGCFANKIREKYGWDYLAVDGSPAIVAALKTNSHNIIEAFVPPMPQTIEKDFDVILMEHFIEHMTSPKEARELIIETNECLNTGGIIILVAPDYLSHRENFWEGDYTHSFVTTLERLKQLLIDGGMKIVYEGYETLGVSGKLFTSLITIIARFFFLLGMPQLLSYIKVGSLALSNKWRNVLFRSCIIVGRKE